LRKIVYAGVTNTSFKQAEETLKKLADIEIADSHIQRIVARIGKEFNKNDEKYKEIKEKQEVKKEQNQIEVASISIDGGRVQIREENKGSGANNPKWMETKVALMQILQSPKYDKDPHPCLPEIFSNKEKILHLVSGLKNETNKIKLNQKKIKENNNQNKTKRENASYQVIKKFIYATIDEAETFGNIIYNKSVELNLHSVTRKAFLGDGDRKNWSIFEYGFRPHGWIPILDFIHSIEYAFEAAKLITDTQKTLWNKYNEFITHIWQGRVLTVIRRLDKEIANLEKINKKTKRTLEKIDSIKRIREYFKNNYNKMNYPEYRKLGLPITSCHVESLIKQFNLRIKSSEKFWNKTIVSGILKIKSSLLSDDNTWQEFWDNRHHEQIYSKRDYIRNAA